MATKPTPGGSDGTYGTELNAFLDESLASDGKVKTEALQTDSTAPVADAAVTNKKYVDDNTTMVPAVTGAGTGYGGEESITLANGVIIKTKRSASVSTGDTISFAAAFPTALISVTMTPNIATAQTNSIDSATVNGFNVNFGGGGAKDIFWIAIGR